MRKCDRGRKRIVLDTARRAVETAADGIRLSLLTARHAHRTKGNDVKKTDIRSDTLTVTGRRRTTSLISNPERPDCGLTPSPAQELPPHPLLRTGAAIDTSTTDPNHWKATALNARWKDFDHAAGPCEYDERKNGAVLRIINGSEAVIWREDKSLSRSRLGNITSSWPIMTRSQKRAPRMPWRTGSG
jgi:hypothetical protein